MNIKFKKKFFFFGDIILNLCIENKKFYLDIVQLKKKNYYKMFKKKTFSL
jgi:hypothetical protein